MNHIAANVASRQAAEEVFGLAIDESGSLLSKFDSAAVARFWIELRSLIDETIPHAKPEPLPGFPEPMTDEQAHAFGKTPMPWGIHEGKPVDDVPMWYLQNIIEPDEFKEKVKRYLRSQRVAGEHE